MIPTNVFEEFVIRYGPRAGERGPELMVREAFRATPDDWQLEVLRAYGRGERKISVRSAHGPGKTCVVAWCIWHQALTRFPQKTVATAPSGGQLDGALVAELMKWGGRLPKTLYDLYDVKARGIYLKTRPKEGFFEARTSRAETPEALQGIHSDPGYVLIVIDEASGVAEQVFESAVGSMSQKNAQTIMCSNPVRTSGTFFDSHNRLKHEWFTVHVGYWPDPDTRPAGAYHSDRISDEYALEVASKYGDRSNAYRVRVLGEFPVADEDTVIPYEYVASAQQRDIEMPYHIVEIWGIDVARSGSSLNVLVRRNKLGVPPNIMYWSGVDLMETAGRIKVEWDRTPPSLRPEAIFIDANGLGAGVADRLIELGLPVVCINVSESAGFKDRYHRLRDQLWYECREWLSRRNVSLPASTGAKDCPFERLARDLVSARVKPTSSGKLKVESKEDMRKRGVDSPDFADALILTFAGEPATLIHGSEGNTRGDWGKQVSWNQPLSRGRKGWD